ncbi:MAG: hypothetical protein ACE149_03475 [Armatimonadota bacterium]
MTSRSAALTLLALILLALPSACLAGAGGGVAIENEFIRIRVNPGPAEAGRFAVDTTGGDPSRSADDNKVLIYGAREPWTSYTTVIVDGVPYLFGGPSERRAGHGAAATGVATKPHVSGDSVETTARAGEIGIAQTLSFARSPTTRVKDTALITYQVTNHGAEPAAVGLRIVLDTMLGANDGAPLRAGGRAISSATQLTGKELPDYWQAFDSLAEPAVISQGTLRAPGLTPPDRLEMVDWGTLADSPWEFSFPTGADFTRKGEESQDTAVALYWNPAPLAPGKSRIYATMYGVGGVSLSPAQLSLGLTAPAEVDFQYDDAKPFTVIAYLENSGGFASRGTKLGLELSEGLALAGGQPTIEVGLLQPGQTKQAVWKVLPTGKVTGTLQISATATSENLEPNRVTREVVVNSPPQLVVKLSAPGRLSVTSDNRYSPSPFQVSAEITNRGAQIGRSLAATLVLPDGLALAAGDATQLAERIESGKTATFTWSVRATGLPTGQLSIALNATAAGAKPVSARCTVIVPKLTPELRVHPAAQSVPLLTDGQPTVVPVAVKLVPAREFAGARVSLSYDPAVVEPLYVSRGEGFVEGGRLLSPWSAGLVSPGAIEGIGGERGDAPALNAAEVTLFTVVFMVKEPGKTAITLEATAMRSTGSLSDLRVVNGSISVQPAE